MRSMRAFPENALPARRKLLSKPCGTPEPAFFPAGNFMRRWRELTGTFSICCRTRAVILDEPEALNVELDNVWARIEEAHERSEIGNLVRPADLYLSPEDLARTSCGAPRSRSRISGGGALDDDPRRTKWKRLSFPARPALPWLDSDDDGGS